MGELRLLMIDRGFFLKDGTVFEGASERIAYLLAGGKVRTRKRFLGFADGGAVT